jgi:hypothetical protein
MATKFFLSVCLLCLLATTASADSFSFTGSFATYDDVQLFSFTIASDQTVTFLTLGYAGGTNAADQVISPGGFDSTLTLFDPSGHYVGAWAEDSSTSYEGLTLDAYNSQDLAAGTYTLALTETPNESFDGILADGFNGGPNPYGCDFCDFEYSPLDRNWAVDILTVDSAFEEGLPPSISTPEPGSLILLSSGLGCFTWVRRRKLFRAGVGN